MTSSRPSWDEYFLEILDATARRATCDRGRCACVLVSPDHALLVTGYVGSPAGFPHCDDVGHDLRGGHCHRTIHAEQNAIATAARLGISLRGARAYTTLTPCRTCAMLFLAVGVSSVVSQYLHSSDEGLTILTRGSVSYTLLNVEVPYVP